MTGRFSCRCLRPVAPYVVEGALDFGLEAGEQRTHRLHLQGLRVQLRHNPTLLLQRRKRDWYAFDNALIDLRHVSRRAAGVSHQILTHWLALERVQKKISENLRLICA